MKHSKQEKIEYLFDEIGRINDSLVQEAMVYRREPKKLPIKAVSVAATLLVACLVLFRVGSGLLPKVSKDDIAVNESGRIASLERLLTEHTDTLDCRPLSAQGELNFFDSNAYLVWQESNGNRLYVSRPLKADELEKLKTMATQGTPVGNTSPVLDCRVWILCGDGSVFSPYLRSSAGNIGVGELFDYNAEIIPSSNFTAYVSDILQTP